MEPKKMTAEQVVAKLDTPAAVAALEEAKKQIGSLGFIAPEDHQAIYIRLGLIAAALNEAARALCLQMHQGAAAAPPLSGQPS